MCAAANSCTNRHIDYIGYDVFPMAIEKDILMATAFTPENTDHLRCELHNVVMHFAHTTFQCDLMQPETIELTHIGMTRWSNYFKAVSYTHLTLPTKA